MPNKTIYVKDSDLPLWEAAQQKLGESISSLFAEFLRHKLGTPIDGLILIRRDDRRESYQVMFAPIPSKITGGFLKPHNVQGQTELKQFLMRLGFTADAAADALSALRKESSISARFSLPRDLMELFE